jgi:hypothetical protein
MKNRKIKVLMRIQIVLFISILFVACNEEVWMKHYNVRPELVSNSNLWATIEATPELSSFAKILKTYGYDKTLSQSQAYTVFAPNNQALANLDTTNMNVNKELIQNHVARFIQAASGSNNVPVGVLNGKRINLSYKDANYYFGDAAFAVPSKSIVSTNGIIHILSDHEPFFPNTMEYLAKGTGLDSIMKYFYSSNKIIFDQYSSVPGSIVNGQQTYLDSVFINYNPLLSFYGYINLEDSSYTMLVPTNAAWNTAYDRIRPYFVSYISIKLRADSLVRANTTTALIQDLIFSNTKQISPADSMVSTSYHTFYRPQYLFDGAEKIITSNGVAYVTNELKIDALDSWHKPIKVEAERVLGRTNSPLGTPINERSPAGVTSISNGMYLRLSPTSSSANPWVTIEIPGTLASYYDIYCVFVSPKLIFPDPTNVFLPCKVNFSLTYITSTGKVNNPVDVFPSATGTIITRPEVMDTVLVASNFKFPSSNYGEKVNTVTLKIASKAGSETTLYSRELLIDCILLKPKKQ